MQASNNNKLYGQYLALFTPTFNRALRIKFGKDYKMIQYSPKYKHESLQILSYQYSVTMGGSNDSLVLQLSMNDIYGLISAELDHLALHGFGHVILDENDRVCLVGYNWDHCHRPPKYETQNEKVNHMRELCSAAYKHDKPGEIICGARLAARPDMRGKHLYQLIAQQKHLIRNLMGYKVTYGLYTHASTIQHNQSIQSRNNTLQKCLITNRWYVFLGQSALVK